MFQSLKITRLYQYKITIEPDPPLSGDEVDIMPDSCVVFGPLCR